VQSRKGHMSISIILDRGTLTNEREGGEVSSRPEKENEQEMGSCYAKLFIREDEGQAGVEKGTSRPATYTSDGISCQDESVSLQWPPSNQFVSRVVVLVVELAFIGHCLLAR
jgi:hypothetical protein